MSDHLPNEGLRLTEKIEAAHPEMPGYTLYPGDLLVREDDGSWFKEAPGLGIGGFKLTPDQESALEPVRFAACGLDYVVESLLASPPGATDGGAS